MTDTMILTDRTWFKPLLASAFVILNGLDAVTTKVIIDTGGIELNPVGRWLVPTWHGYAIKVLVAVFVALYFGVYRADRHTARVFTALVVAYTAVVANNLYWL